MGDTLRPTLRPGLTGRTRLAIADVLSGRRRGRFSGLLFVGPAVVASIAYIDPGNYATNIEAGARYGYGLLWVVILANLVAMLFQAMSAKLGIVTGHNLAELSRQAFARPIVIFMWLAGEVAAMATDLAEFLGGGIGIALLLHVPLLAGMAITGVVTYAILLTEGAGFRPLELIIGGLIGVIGLCYLVELMLAPPDWRAAGLHAVVPQLADGGAVTLAVGIIGATIMPHAIYLHSGLTQARAPVLNEADRRRLIRYSNRETVIALSFAGLINAAMVLMAARVFHAGHSDVAEIETAYTTLKPLLGAAAAGVFLVSLTASGISSSVVGTLAGQLIMQGFIEFRIPVWLRRLVTMAPAFAVVALGYNATASLVASQVVLSLTLPVPLVALTLLSRRRSVMGPLAAGLGLSVAAALATVLIVGLNLVLLVQTF